MRKHRALQKICGRILAVLLSIALLGGCIGMAADDPLASFADNHVEFGLKDADPAYFPGYVHYKPAGFFRKCNKMLKLAQSGREEKAFALYDELYAEAVYALDLSYTADLAFSEDVQNTYFREELAYIETAALDVTDAFKTACHKLCESACAASFKEHINSDFIYESYADYAAVSPALKALLARETELEQEYNLVNDSLDLYNIDWSTDEPKIANKKLGEVFLKLVSVRKQIAVQSGYPDFAAYMDDTRFMRDYTEEDLLPLKETVKAYGALLDYYSWFFSDYAMEERIEAETLFDNVGGILSDISDRAGDAYTLLREKNLVSMGYENSRADFSATYKFPSTNGAAIEGKFYEDSEFYAYSTFAHEMGHFAYCSSMPNSNPLFCEDGCMDVNELHSNFLEILFSIHADKLYPFPEAFQGYEIANQARSVLDGCIYDDWQRAIYQSETDMTLDEINALYKDICLAYGLEEYDGMEYDWMYISHNFTEPMYYISYATSAFAALELWTLAQKNYDKAVKIWEKALTVDANEIGYLEALETIGLPFFGETDVAWDTLDEVSDGLDVLEAAVCEQEEAA